MKKNLIASVLKGMTLFVLTILLCRFTKGFGAAAIVGFAFVMALMGKQGWALVGYIFFPFMVITNPFLIPKEGITPYVMRLGPMIVTAALLVSASARTGHHKIPMGGIWLYLLVAAVSSIDGYYPEISYLKIVNCAILFIGLAVGFRNIDKRPQDVELLRQFLLVMTSFVVWGSILMLIATPGAAYLTTMRAGLEEMSLEVANEAARNMEGLALFAGVTNQSQCLAVVLPCSLAWLVCDMLMIEKRVTRYHALTILAGVPLLYMTRSRTCMLTSMVAVCVLYFYCMRKVNLRPQVKRKLHAAMGFGIFLIAVAAIVAECRSGAISKWVLKYEGERSRSVSESLTKSRQGQFDSSIADFKRNPLLGSGFQVSYEMKYIFKGHKGLIMSASIEKGFLPLMILGETGIVGVVMFLLFLCSFYGGCNKRGLYCTATLFTIFLATNLGEGTFFSPGGIGGIMWVLCLGGGFVLDTVAIYKHRLERIAQEQQFAMMQQQMEGGI